MIETEGWYELDFTDVPNPEQIKRIKSALKLQELVKERINQLPKKHEHPDKPPCEACLRHHMNYLVEESEKESK